MLDLSQKRLVIFDWDGTLFDSTGVIAYSLQEACKVMQLTVPTVKQAKNVIGLGFQEAIEELVGPLDAVQFTDFMAAYRRHYFTNEARVTLYEGSLEILQALKVQQRLLAVATGKSRAGLNRVLLAGELKHFFDATKTADETTSKPHPHMLFELLEELDVEPQEAVMVGDTTYDIDMAHAAGIESVAVQYGAHDLKTLERSKPSVLVADVMSLANVLGVQIKV